MRDKTKEVKSLAKFCEFMDRMEQSDVDGRTKSGIPFDEIKYVLDSMTDFINCQNEEIEFLKKENEVLQHEIKGLENDVSDLRYIISERHHIEVLKRKMNGDA